MVDLESLLSKFKPHRNYRYKGAHRMAHVPSLGDMAYLNIIHDAADAEIQGSIIDPLCLPRQLRDFYRTYNGVDLFSDSLSVYGFFPVVFQYERADMDRSYPYNIMDLNERFLDNVMSSDVFFFGSYGYDRFPVFMDKSTGSVYYSSEDDPNRIRATWPDFETWIENEIRRLSECFDEYGNRIVELEETLPGQN